MEILQEGTIDVNIRENIINIKKDNYKVEIKPKLEDEIISVKIDDVWTYRETFFLPYGDYVYRSYKKNYGIIEIPFSVEKSDRVIETQLYNNLKSLKIIFDKLPSIDVSHELSIKFFDEDKEIIKEFIITDSSILEYTIDDFRVDKTYTIKLYKENLYSHDIEVYSSDIIINMVDDMDTINITYNELPEVFYKVIYHVNINEDIKDYDTSFEIEDKGLYRPNKLEEDDTYICTYVNNNDILEYYLKKENEKVKINLYQTDSYLIAGDTEVEVTIDSDIIINEVEFYKNEFPIIIKVPYEDINVEYKLFNTTDDEYKYLIEKGELNHILFANAKYTFRLSKFGFITKTYDFDISFYNRRIEFTDFERETTEVIIKFLKHHKFKNLLPSFRVQIKAYDGNTKVFSRIFRITDFIGNQLKISDFPMGKNLELFVKLLFLDEDDNPTTNIDKIFNGDLSKMNFKNKPDRSVFHGFVNIYDKDTEHIITLNRNNWKISFPYVGELICKNSLIKINEEFANNLDFYIEGEKVDRKIWYKDGVIKFAILNKKGDIRYSSFVRDGVEYDLYIDYKKPYFENLNYPVDTEVKSYLSFYIGIKGAIVEFYDFEDKSKVWYKRKSEETYYEFDFDETVLSRDEYDFKIEKPSGIIVYKSVDLRLTDNFNNSIYLLD